MRAAPPVQVALTRSGGWRAVQAVLYGLAAGTLAMWGLGSAAAFAPAAAAAACTAWWLLPGARGTLAWDGSGWRFAGRPCEVAAAIDLGTWLLLRLSHENDRGALWLGLG